MRYSLKRRTTCALLAGAGLVALAQAPACAQDSTTGQPGSTAAEPPDDATLDEIVVTGTLVRGKPPVGASPITLGADKLAETGAATSNELLASIPQVSNYFNNVPVADLSVAVNQFQVSRPNLRNISPTTATGSATLILVDGHRVASVGTKQSSVDPDLIPIGAIERVEVVLDGGSATYGADAVAGVINFITRRRFDGVKVDAHYGFADDYWQTDASFTAGRDWGSGSAYVSYTFTKNDALFGRDRDFIRSLDYTSQPYVPRGRACDLPNVAINTSIFGFTVSSVNYAYPSLVANTVNACDPSDDKAIVPSAERHGVIASLTQDLDDSTKIDLRAFYSRRETLSTSPLEGVVTMASSNPYYVLPPGVTPVAPPFSQGQAVSFSFAPVLGRASQRSTTLVEEWGANAEVTKSIADNWQLRGLFNYSRSNSEFSLPQASQERLNAAGASSDPATAINPYDITRTSPALIADIADNEIAGQAIDDLLDLRLIAEGKLFALPGGDVRLAVGYEHMREEFKQRYVSGIRIGTLSTHPFGSYDRDVDSLFGELQVPVFDDGDAAGLHSLVLSAAGRYDRYSDFGSTFNPKLGFTYKPFRWLGLRGNWGTSFTAPTALDQLASAQNEISSFPFVAFVRPGDTPTNGSITVALQGARPNLQPQTAETWSIGFDADPPFLPGLHLTGSYYDVVFKDILSTPTPNPAIFGDFPGNITSNPNGLSVEQLRAFAALAPNGASVIEPLIASGTPVYEVVDFRTGNFGILKVKGLDFGADYRLATGFGGLDFSIHGNYQLSRKQQVSPTSPVTDLLRVDNPKLTLQAAVGTTVGAFRAQAIWNHTGGFAVDPTSTVPVQTRISAYNTVNLFFKYDVPGESLVLKDLSVTLNVGNVFDQDPPVSLRSQIQRESNGYANGFTLGRMFTFGVSKKF